jgi:type IV fimbrial biogenesis protein FimT
MRPHGFTLIEFVIVLVILAVIAAIAAPNLSTMLANQRLRAAATDFFSALVLARSEAIKRGVQVQVVPVSGADWNAGWRVVAPGNEQVEKSSAPGYRVEIALAPSVITYERSGRLSGAGSARVEFRDSAKATSVSSRCVTIDPSGMPHLVVSACS